MSQRAKYLHYVCTGSPNCVGPIPMEEVAYFRTDDDSTVVVTGKGEYRISTPLSEIFALLDPEKFRQVHRSMVVNTDHIGTIRKEDGGRIVLMFKERGESCTVDRLYCGQFQER